MNSAGNESIRAMLEPAGTLRGTRTGRKKITAWPHAEGVNKSRHFPDGSGPDDEAHLCGLGVIRPSGSLPRPVQRRRFFAQPNDRFATAGRSLPGAWNFAKRFCATIMLGDTPMDHVSKAVRSKNMAAIRSRGNLSTEIVLGKLLWATGLRGYRKHWPVVGTPDFAWPGLKVAVFVDGCFWHGCRCKTIPTTNVAFWRNKIRKNQERDQRVNRQLHKEGWASVRVWECAVRCAETLSRIKRILTNRKNALIRP